MDGFELRVDEIVSEGNIRFEVDTDLADSLLVNGQKVPVQVYASGDRWVIKDGHRRHAAAKAAGIERLWCVEVAAPGCTQDSIIDQYVINQQRTGLNALEKAEVYFSLKETYGLSQKDIASKFAVSEAEVSLSLAALNAHPTIRDAMLDGRLSPSAAEPVLSLPYEDQGKVAPIVIKEKTVRKVVAAVKTYRSANSLDRQQAATSKTKTTANPVETMALEALSAALRNLELLTDGQITSPDAKSQALFTLGKIADAVEAAREAVITAEQETTPDEAFSWEELATI